MLQTIELMEKINLVFPLCGWLRAQASIHLEHFPHRLPNARLKSELHRGNIDGTLELFLVRLMRNVHCGSVLTALESPKRVDQHSLAN